MSKRCVLFLNNSLIFGGAEKQTVTLLNHLDAPELEIHFAYLARVEDVLGELNSQRIKGVYCLDKQSSFDLRFLFRLYRLIQRIKPDSVVCVNTYPSFLAYCLRSMASRRYRITQIMHSTIPRNSPEIFLNNTIYRNMIKPSDKIIFVCQTQMQYCSARYGIPPGRASVIYNGVDEKFFSSIMDEAEKVALRATLGFDTEAVVLCVCAALRPEKRHMDLLTAFEGLVKKDVPLRLLIVGDGPERSNIEQYVKAAGLNNYVIITGFKKDVRPYLEIADVFVLSSVTEAFPMAVLEAMSMGKPVIGPQVGGIPEQITDGENGYIYPVGDTLALAKALEAFVDSGQGKQMGIASRRRIMQNFTLDKMLESYIKIIAA